MLHIKMNKVLLFTVPYCKSKKTFNCKYQLYIHVNHFVIKAVLNKKHKILQCRSSLWCFFQLTYTLQETFYVFSKMNTLSMFIFVECLCHICKNIMSAIRLRHITFQRAVHKVNKVDMLVKIVTNTQFSFSFIDRHKNSEAVGLYSRLGFRHWQKEKLCTVPAKSYYSRNAFVFCKYPSRMDSFSLLCGEEPNFFASYLFFDFFFFFS